jgi:hypothetical protein
MTAQTDLFETFLTDSQQMEKVHKEMDMATEDWSNDPDHPPANYETRKAEFERIQRQLLRGCKQYFPYLLLAQRHFSRK